MRSVSIVIPAYNEAAALAETLPSVLARVPPAISDCEVLVVDDGSADGTAEVVRRAAARDPRVVLLSHDRNRGKGHALRTGLARARCDWVLFLDADHQARIDDLAPLATGPEPADAVIGYRTGRHDGVDRTLISLVFRAATRGLLGLTVRDVNCPFKLFRRPILQALPLASDGFLIDAEILHRLRARGVAVAEVPVRWHPRHEGTSTIRRRHLPELVRELVRLKLEGWRR